MAGIETTALQVTLREPGGSRTARRLRREGNVPGVIYGGDGEPVSFQVSARTLRHTLADAGAVLDLSVDGGATSLVVIKDQVRHPLTGETVHLDLLRVRLDVAIHAVVALELTGTEEAPGVIDGGVLEHVARELNIEALPAEIPDSLTYDVSQMQIGDTATLESLSAPSTVTLLDDPETVIATLTPPRLQLEEEEEIEEETELVGEGEEEAGEGEAGDEDSGGDDADESAGSDSE